MCCRRQTLLTLHFKNCFRQKFEGLETGRYLHTITRVLEDLVVGVTSVVLVDNATLDVLVTVDMLEGKVVVVGGVTVVVVVDEVTLLVDMG